MLVPNAIFCLVAGTFLVEPVILPSFSCNDTRPEMYVVGIFCFIIGLIFLIEKINWVVVNMDITS
jgi:hypothetical protein